MPRAIEAKTIKTEAARRRLLIEEKTRISVKDVKALIEGDHWADGKFWIGLQPDPSNEFALELFELIKIGFVSRNMTREVVERPVTAILGREPDYKIVGDDKKTPVEANGAAAATGETGETGQTSVFDEYDKMLVDWYTRHEVKDALSKFLFNRIAYGKGTLRIYIPEGYFDVDDNGNAKLPETESVEEALDMIYIEAPEYEDCGIVRDQALMKPYGVTVLKPDETRDILEISFVENKLTFVRQIDATKAADRNPDELPPEDLDLQADKGEIMTEGVDLGGNLLVFEKSGRPLVTDQVKQNQMALNFNLTMMEHNIFGAGFNERTIINADLPSKEVPHPTETGKTMRVLENVPRGVGTIQSLVGLMTLERRPDGAIVQRLERPEVIDREPSDPEAFIKAIGETKQNILEETHQTYVQLAKRAEASGESRIEAKDDFINFILDYETAADDAGIWALSTALRLALNIAKKKELVRKFKTIFKSKVYIGNATSDERRVAREEWKDGVRTTRSLLIILGSNDPDAEIKALITEEPQRRLLEKLLFQPLETPNGTGNGNNQAPASTDDQANRNKPAGDGGAE